MRALALRLGVLVILSGVEKPCASNDGLFGIRPKVSRSTHLNWDGDNDIDGNFYLNRSTHTPTAGHAQ